MPRPDRFDFLTGNELASPRLLKSAPDRGASRIVQRFGIEIALAQIENATAKLS